MAKSKYEEYLDRMERMNTTGLELFYRLRFDTLKLENTIGTAKYAKYAKKIRMQRNTKYRMQFDHEKNPEHREGMQRQIRINCISCCAENDGLKSASGFEKPAFAG